MTKKQKEALMLAIDLYKKDNINEVGLELLIDVIITPEQSPTFIPNQLVDDNGRLWIEPKIKDIYQYGVAEAGNQENKK